MVTVEPFNYYKDYLTVYAIHCSSNESGISGDSGSGTFACLNASGNPTTSSCTPNDGIFNCSHGKDTFFNAYYAWRTSASSVILEMSDANRARARNIAFNSCSSVNMVQIIANSSMRGGTGEMPTSDQPLGVALTSINYRVPNSDWKRVIMHEFGHSFGGLWDEYWNGITPKEYPNMTRTSDPSTVKWKNWIGYKNVGVYQIKSSKQWFRPHQNCTMKDSSNPFCPVCVQQLLNKMAEATGKQMFDTTDIDENNIRIDKMNLDYSGPLVIPDCINGRYVSIIGSEAFKDCNSLTSVTIPSSVQQIDNSAFQNCENLSSVIVQRDVASITHLGKDVFDGCKSTLQITVPTNRVAEYKNKLYWSSYSSIIVPNNNNFIQYDLYDSSNHNITTTLATGKNELYKLVVVDSYTYNITATSTANVSIKLYDSNMNYIVGSISNISSTLSRHLLGGIYYYSVEYSNSSTSGIINTNIVFGNEQHLYEYKVVDSEYHILKCNCGATTGNKVRHTIDPHYIDPIGNGRYKPCLYCGAVIDTWEGGTYPGILSNQTIYAIYEHRLGDNELILSEINLTNEMLIDPNVQHSLDGSYKMDDETILLVEDDTIAYMNGTLVFNNDDELLAT